MMFLCHYGRIRDRKGWKKLRAIWRFIVGLLGVSVPTWVTIIAANYNWFKAPPKQADLVFFAGLVFAVWFICAYIVPLLSSLLLGKGKEVQSFFTRWGRRKLLLFSSPMIILAAIFVVEQVRAGHSHIILWPFLTYLYGAMHYFWVAYTQEWQESSFGNISD